LESRASVAESDIDSLESRASVAESDIDSLESRASVAEADLDSLESRVSVAESDIDSLETRTSNNESTIEDAKLVLYAITDGNLDSTFSSLQSITSEFAANGSNVDDLVGLNTRLTELASVVSILTTSP
jgi:chromosome segregation ATPase